ncbi:hypothetical protein KOR34_27920 [Posidoniimonas corsicana]|uniref:Uncharacterized protein n=1 Tax=Posidoniimonas corsicana TaxID=1938618 RepID=A0A5C5VGP6_9BACT|nr:transporter [Posidoniimonas corsicana]TWT37828.1 hypothetical protein KOR34_27920 [Posidoniimonas corsicana]
MILSRHFLLIATVCVALVGSEHRHAAAKSAALFSPPPLAGLPATIDQEPPLGPGNGPDSIAGVGTTNPPATTEIVPPPPPPVPPRPQGSKGSATTDGAGDQKKDDKLGQEPPDDTLDFLRQSTVLLRPGTVEIERSIEYALGETTFLAVLDGGAVVPEITAARTFLATYAVRYGYSERFQPSLVAPVGLATVEQAHAVGQLSDDDFGLGDIQLGASFLLRDGHDECSDVVLTLSLGAPTGSNALLAPSSATAFLGSGFWAVSTAVNWTRTYDPVVVFASAGYTHRFERTVFGQRIQPGEELTLTHGMGLAINDEVTYSVQFELAHQFDTKVAGIDIENSGVDVASLRHSCIIRTAPQDFWEVFMSAGLTEVTTTVSTGVIFTRRF